MALTAGDLLHGRYRIREGLAAGGAGTVFLADEEPSGVTRVVKELRSAGPEVLASFRDEFALLARLSHPHLLRVLDFGTALLRGARVHYYVAPWLDASPLLQRARKGGSEGAQVLSPVLDALEGLAVLHALDVRHGDFTPSNVLVDEAGHGTLIDLGCAQPFGRTAWLSGTEGYIAPELLQGDVADARADLYSVGKTLERLFELARQKPSAQVARVIERLVRADPAQRPADVREVLEAFKRRSAPVSRHLVPTHLLGRDEQLAQFAAWLSHFQRDEAGPRSFLLVGGPGTGLSRLLREMTWRAQLELSVFRVHPGDAECIGRCLAVAASMDEPVRSLRGVLQALGRMREGGERLLIVVDDYERVAIDQQELLLAFSRVLGQGGNVALLASGRSVPQGADAIAVECGPLGIEAVSEWVAPFLAARKIQEFYSVTAGLPGAIETELRRVCSAPDTSPRGAASDAAKLPALKAEVTAALALVSAAGGALEVVPPLLDWSTAQALIALQLAERDGAQVRLHRDTSSAIAAGGLSRKELRKGHAKLAEALASGAAPLNAGLASRLALHWAEAGQQQRAEEVFLRYSSELWQQPRAAVTLFRSAFQSSVDSEVQLGGAALLLAAGEPRLAIRAAVRAWRVNAAIAADAAVLVVDALRNLGQPARALTLLERWLGQGALAGDARLVDRLARTRLTRGDYTGARQDATRALQLAASPATHGLAHETLGLALSYLGELAAAERELALATAGLAEHGSPRESYRALNHAGIIAFRAGHVDDAIARYGQALALAEDAELHDLLPVGLLNLGTAEQQAGLWGSALRRYERGVSFARAVGRVDTELTLEYNLANLYAEIGAFERAEDVLSRLAPRVSAAKLAHLEFGIRLVSSELSLLLGQTGRAEALLHETGGQGRELFELGLRRADVFLANQNHAAAEELVERLAADFSADVVGELALGLEVLRGRLEARLGNKDALARLERVRQQAHREGLAALEATVFTTQFEAAEVLRRADDARAYRERARRLWDRVAADLPAALGQAFWRHPRRSRLNEVSSTGVPLAQAQVAGESRAYRRLLSLNRRLGSPHSLSSLLEHAVQAAVDLTEAERGFVLLRDAGSESFAVAVSSQSYAGGRGPSHGIVARVLQSEEPVLTTNALEDPRFATQRSVHALQLKSVLCVPILSPEGALGALYVDSSLERGHFSAPSRELLVAFADQLAIAIVNARLREQLEQRTRQLESKVVELEEIARDRGREVERLKAIELREQGLRHEYPQIIGRGPAMRRVLERLDRITDSEVNVLILGESGTGKELVARALHANGPRKEAAFVGINCGALPENLLESELFGYVRGAFTGAARDKLGLMQAAHGGTLFLDEIGELPPATQVKLLRVLQEREVRPLGALQAAPVDLRLLAATHRDLRQDVTKGRFREDLYYRIAVVSVELPPLRERLEDLPAIALQVLARLAQESGRKPPTLSQDALRKLSAHPLPGNVRELQNILTRAFVMAGGSRITARDLEMDDVERGRAAAANSSVSRQEFLAQERVRMIEALQRTRWNVAAVSRMLGLSRATVHRKIKQYRLARES